MQDMRSRVAAYWDDMYTSASYIMHLMSKFDYQNRCFYDSYIVRYQ